MFSRLPPRSAASCDRPVALPPGRDRLVTSPVAIGSFAIVKTIGMTEVTCFSAGTAVPVVTMTLVIEPDQLGRELGQAVRVSICPPVFDRDGTSLDPAEVAQSLHEGGRSTRSWRKPMLPQENRWSVASPLAAPVPRSAPPPHRQAT